MKKHIELLERQLEIAKAELTKWQEQFKVDVEKNINNSTFERNAINDLLVMQELKTKISTLELILQPLKIIYK